MRHQKQHLRQSDFERQTTVLAMHLAKKAINMNISRHDKDNEKQLNAQVKSEQEFLEDDDTHERLRFLTWSKFSNLTRNSHLFVFQPASSLNWNFLRNELRNLYLLPAPRAGNVDVGCYLRVNYNITTFATVAYPTIRNWSALYVKGCDA